MADSPDVEQKIQEFEGVLARASRELDEDEFARFLTRCGLRIEILMDDHEEEYDEEDFDEYEGLELDPWEEDLDDEDVL